MSDKTGCQAPNKTSNSPHFGDVRCAELSETNRVLPRPMGQLSAPDQVPPRLMGQLSAQVNLKLIEKREPHALQLAQSTEYRSG